MCDFIDTCKCDWVCYHQSLTGVTMCVSIFERVNVIFYFYFLQSILFLFLGFKYVAPCLYYMHQICNNMQVFNCSILISLFFLCHKKKVLKDPYIVTWLELGFCKVCQLNVKYTADLVHNYNVELYWVSRMR